jgi:hypothetical protein
LVSVRGEAFRNSSLCLGATVIYEFLPDEQFYSIAILVHFWIFIFSSSAHLSSYHLNLCLPILLTGIDIHSVILFTLLSLSVLTTCPTHRIICALIYLTVCLTSQHVYLLIIYYTSSLILFSYWVVFRPL